MEVFLTSVASALGGGRRAAALFQNVRCKVLLNKLIVQRFCRSVSTLIMAAVANVTCRLPTPVVVAGEFI